MTSDPQQMTAYDDVPTPEIRAAARGYDAQSTPENAASRGSYELPGMPTEAERIKSLSAAAVHVSHAFHFVNDAGNAVVPSSPRNVLSRTENFDYQRALSAAREGLHAAEAILTEALGLAVPRRCEWPGGHLGPIVHVEPFESVQRCEACGEEWGK